MEFQRLTDMDFSCGDFDRVRGLRGGQNNLVRNPDPISRSSGIRIPVK